MKKKGTGADRGAAAVEFALVAMMLVTLLFGTIEFGRFWMIQSSLSQIAREGAREMAIHGTTGPQVAIIEAAMQSRVADLNLTVPVTANASTTAGGLCEAGQTARATIRANGVPTMTGITFWDSINLTGKAEMRCGG